MKLAVLGNSHAACFRTGWDTISSHYPDVEITFFAHRGDNLGELDLVDQCLTPKNEDLAAALAFTSKGKRVVALRDYDTFLMCGLDMIVPWLHPRLSLGVKCLTCSDIVRSCVSYRVASLIRSGVGTPIYFAHNPLLAAFAPIGEPSIPYAEILPMMTACIDLEDAHLLEQPAETIENGRLTKSRYSRGSMRLDLGDKISNKPHRTDDPIHMNETFGALYLSAFLEGRLGISRAS